MFDLGLTALKGQNLVEVSNLDGLDCFPVASKEAVVAPGHVVVEHPAPEPQVVGQGPGVGELSRQDRGLPSPEHEKLKNRFVFRFELNLIGTVLVVEWLLLL